jgi:DNA-binding NarL/FixJ family response regulator
MPDQAIKTVAVFDASEDTVEMLKTLLSFRGYRAVAGHADDVKSGETDFIAFLEEHKPDGIIWDIAPPYDRNWNFFKLLRTIGPLTRCALVLTTTHKQHLDALAGLDTGAFEIIGKPYDMGVIIDAVERGIDEKLSAGPRAFGQARNDL